MGEGLEKVCRIHLAVGQVEACPGRACPFWELGDGAFDEGCALERLALDLDRPDLAAYLLDLRETLERAGERERGRADRTDEQILPPGLAGA